MSGKIYIIGCRETMRVKIGYTKGNPYSRLSQLQTGSPTELTLAVVIPGGFDDERRLHQRFGQYRLHGEWFALTDEIFEFMQMCVWLAAADLVERGGKSPRWMRAALASMNESHPLPEKMVALI